MTVQEKHPFQKIDYEYLRPSAKYLTPKQKHHIYTLDDKGIPYYRNIYYGVIIPDDELEKVKEFNEMISLQLKTNSQKWPHKELPDQKDLVLPESWSFHDSFRFADAAQYYYKGALRDVVEHSPWINELKTFVLPEKAAEILQNGQCYIYGRDIFGNPNLILCARNLSTKSEDIENMKAAMTF